MKLRWTCCAAAAFLSTGSRSLPWSDDESSPTDKLRRASDPIATQVKNTTLSSLNVNYMTLDQVIGSYLALLLSQGRNIVLDEVDLFTDFSIPEPLEFDASRYNDIVLTYYDKTVKIAYQSRRVVEPMGPPWAETKYEQWTEPVDTPWQWRWRDRSMTVQILLDFIQPLQKKFMPHITEAPSHILITKYKLDLLTWVDTRQDVYYLLSYRNTNVQAAVNAAGEFFVGDGVASSIKANASSMFVRRAAPAGIDDPETNSSFPINLTAGPSLDNWNPDTVIQTYWNGLARRRDVTLDEVSLVRIPPFQPTSTFQAADFKKIWLTFYDREERRPYESRKEGANYWQTEAVTDWEEPVEPWQWQWRDRGIHIDRALSSLQAFQTEDLHFDEAPYKINIDREIHPEWAWADTRGQVYYEFFYYTYGFQEPKVVLTADQRFYYDPSVFPNAARPALNVTGTRVVPSSSSQVETY